MARIPPAELERLKAEVSVVRLAEAKGVELKRRGKELVGRCPFHEDDTPSLAISPPKNVWRCFGACSTGGSVVDWVMKAEGVSVSHALQILRAGLPEVPAGRSRGPTKGLVPKHSTVPKLPGLASADAEDQALLASVVDHYHQTLQASPEAMEYLTRRGLGSRELVERFRLGYANRTLGYRLPAKNRKEGAELRGRLTHLGVFRETGHEHLAGSLVVPIFDAAGQVVQMYGRKILDNLRPGTATHLYLPGAQRGVWNRDGIRGASEVILCEALLDAMTFWVAGYRNVTTAYGVNGMTPDLWDAFREQGTERVLVAFDRDEAGERAAEQVSALLTERGIEAWRIRFPKGMDANEYATKVVPATASLERVIRNAVWLGKGRAPDRLRDESPRATPVGASPAGGTGGTAAEEGKGEGEREVGDVREGEARAECETAPIACGASVPALPALPAEPAPPARIPDSPPASVASPPSPPSPPSPVRRVVVPEPTAPLVAEDGEHWMHFGDRSYRVQGLADNTSPRVLKVVVRAVREGAGFHTDSFDMNVSRLRQLFAKQAAEEMGVEESVTKREVGSLLLALEAARDRMIRERLQPTQEEPGISEGEREEALALLGSPALLDEVLADFTRVGVVGETTNKLVGYLAAVSRKLPRPLAVVVQSSSAAGKSSLMEAVLDFIPEEERLAVSAVTAQALYYLQEVGLSHKVLAISEEEGAERASYSLKLLQSESVLTILSTDKDPATGRHVAHPYRVEGPVMIFMTTTSIEMDEELLNRCLVLTVDEGREQTRAIHRLQRQRQTLPGVLEDEERSRIVRRHQNAQRLLRPLRVVNPYAEELTFQDHQTRTRRDHMKYLTLIQAIALLHQHQREVKTARTASGVEVAYLEATREDIRMADRLMGEVLGQSLDELPPQTRRLLGEIASLVETRGRQGDLPREAVRFTRRELREATGFGDTQLKVHLARLVELEYLVVHPTGRGQGWCYELAYPGASWNHGTPGDEPPQGPAEPGPSDATEGEGGPSSPGPRPGGLRVRRRSGRGWSG